MSLLTEAGSKLERRFLRNALIPTAIFLLVSLGAVLDAWWGFSYLLDHYTSAPTSLNVLLLVGILVVIGLTSLLVDSGRRIIVEFFEGMHLMRLWDHLEWRPLGPLETPGIRAQ